MEAKFEVKMTQKVMYNFLLNHTYRSAAGVVGLLFGLSAFVLCIVTFGNVPVWQSILYLLFGIWFFLYLPLNLYLRSGKQVKANPVFQKPICYVVNDNGIATMQGDKNALIEWKDLLKVRETKISLLVYTGKRYSFVLPKESMGEQYAKVTELIEKHMDPKKVKLK